MPSPSSLLIVCALALGSPAVAAPSAMPEKAATPAASPTPAATAKPTRNLNAPVVIHIGTMAVMTIREPLGSISVAERAATVQSRINQVLLHHPYLTWMDVKLLREHGVPTIYWGPFPITAVDAAHARDNNFSSPDLLAHAWANSMRTAVKAFFAAKKMPDHALLRTATDNVYTYKRTDNTMNQPTQLKNTRYIFSPADFEWGPGVKESGQNGFVVFIRKDAGQPPQQIYLGNGQGTFTEYDWVRPEDTP